LNRIAALLGSWELRRRPLIRRIDLKIQDDKFGAVGEQR
jgi:hypothetical protein